MEVLNILWLYTCVWCCVESVVHGMLLCDRVNIGEQTIKVAQNLPAGYLSCELAGPGRAVCHCIITL